MGQHAEETTILSVELIVFCQTLLSTVAVYVYGPRTAMEEGGITDERGGEVSERRIQRQI